MNLQQLNAFVGNQAAKVVANAAIGFETITMAYDQQLPVHEKQVKADQAAALKALLTK